MSDRIAQGLRYLTEEFGATADEFRRDNHPGGDMLLTGLINQGYAKNGQGGLIVATDSGRRRLVAEAPVAPVEIES